MYTEPAHPAGNGFPSDRRLQLLLCPKRVRVLLGGRVIADSRRVLLLRDGGRPPTYYFPDADLLRDALEPSREAHSCPRRGPIRYWHVRAGNALRENAAWSCPDLETEAHSLHGHVAFDWDAMDAWFEEDEEVYVHARDPFTRIDILPGSQHVLLQHEGLILAESRRPLLLFETGLPVRYYLPVTDARMDLLLPSNTRTRCPYKGEARYYTLRSGDALLQDLFWRYTPPTLEATRIAGLLSFYPPAPVEAFIDGVSLLSD